MLNYIFFYFKCSITVTKIICASTDGCLTIRRVVTITNAKYAIICNGKTRNTDET